MLELKALHEGTRKMGECMAFSQHLFYAGHTGNMHFIEGHAKGKSRIPGNLIDIQQYKPMWVMGGAYAMPKKLDFTSSTMSKWEE